MFFDEMLAILSEEMVSIVLLMSYCHPNQLQKLGPAVWQTDKQFILSASTMQTHLIEHGKRSN